MDGLKYFIGKVCTIFVDPINQPLNEEKIINYFVGRVIEIDSRGLSLEHLSTKCRTYFMLNKITAVAEEYVEIVSEDSEKYKQLVSESEELKKSESQKKPQDMYDLRTLTGLVG